jgi:hypothetical protein
VAQVEKRSATYLSKRPSTAQTSRLVLDVWAHRYVQHSQNCSPDSWARSISLWRKQISPPYGLIAAAPFPNLSANFRQSEIATCTSLADLHTFAPKRSRCAHPGFGDTRVGTTNAGTIPAHKHNFRPLQASYLTARPATVTVPTPRYSLLVHPSPLHSEGRQGTPRDPLCKLLTYRTRRGRARTNYQMFNSSQAEIQPSFKTAFF